MLQISKLTVGSLAAMTLFSCSEEPLTQNIEEEPSITVEKLVEPRQSPLEAQIMLMLEGLEGDQKVLRHAVETIEWDVILKTWKSQIKVYTTKHGKAPEKKHNMNAYRTLSLIQAQIELEVAKKKNDAATERLERTIQSAIEEERKKER